MMFVLKDQKINNKRGWGWPIFLKKEKSINFISNRYGTPMSRL